MKPAGPSLRIALLTVAGALALLLMSAALFWLDLEPQERAKVLELFTGPRIALAALLSATALGTSGLYLYRLDAAAGESLRRLTEAVRLVVSANPAHRLDAQPDARLQALAQAVNDLAAERMRLRDDVGKSIVTAKARLEQERNRLAALVSELDQCVLVCNRDGRILLFNAAASALFGAGGQAPATHLLGLGRSVFGIFDRGLIQHAIDSVQARGDRDEQVSAHFVTADSAGRLLRVQAAPVFGPPEATAVVEPPEADAAVPVARALTGFVLLVADVTEQIDSDARSVALFQDLVEATRAAVASIRAAIENLIENPQLDARRRGQFTQIVQSEAVRLSQRLDLLSADVSERLRRRWPLEEMRGVDLLTLAGARIQRRQGLRARVDSADSDLWLRVDSFTLAQALSSLAGRLQEQFAIHEVRFRLQAGGPHAQLDVAWVGVPLSSETAFTWQNDAFTLGGEDSPLSLAQVMERHGGEAWYQRDTPTQTNYFRLLLPVASAQAVARAGLRAPSRPEFYDFDLFHRSEATAAWDARPLADLSYTVFDTETTGLDPAGGDEIIAIGATRIVNGRLLQAETFESLVDPGRNVSDASIQVHGITPEQLDGQPPIGQVLPRFRRFAEDTVLVGHNAAFDLRFLQLKEQSTGVRFEQPVLDTLLLAAVTHPTADSHGLEAIAQRLGIDVVGRHTALGDARMTAEVFLRLLPMLEAQGIRTLGEARAASERTYYSRLKY
jgi:DNA polymerase III subunit epsilon